MKMSIASSFIALIAVAAVAVVSAQPGATSWTEETAVSSNAVADSVGVNVHLNYASYTASYPEFKRLLLQSGIKHVRNSLNFENPQPGIDLVRDLGAHGIKFDQVFDSRSSAPQLQSWIAQLKPQLELVEGANEYDLSHQADWVEHVITYQQRLYSVAHHLGVQVIGPSMTSTQAYEQVGDIHQFMDFGNMHNYFAGYNPGTVGWGGAYKGSLYGSLAYNMRAAQTVSGSLPIMSTETGYCTLAGVRNGVTPEIAARYLPRLYLEQWLAHVPRTYVYEFIDEGHPGCDSHLGLVTSALQPKPGYVAVRSLLHDLDSSPSSGGGARVGLRFTGDMEHIHHVLVQKNAHQLQLLIWNETPSWNTNDGTGQPIAVAPRNIRIALEAPWKTDHTKNFADSGEFEDIRPLSNVSETTLPIADRVTVVDLHD